MSPTLYLCFPVYLSQWYAAEQRRLDGTFTVSCRYETRCPPTAMEAVPTRRGSLERAVLHESLCRPPRDWSPAPPEGATLRLLMPWTEGRDPVRWCYLPPKAALRLERVVRMRMRKDLWLWMEKHYDSGRLGVRLEDAVYSYMAERGISDTDANYEAVRQQYRRQRDVYRKLRMEN